MKLDFNLKEKKVSLNADVEKLVEHRMDLDKDKPHKKTRYQIKQEEKRKLEELKHKQDMQRLFIGVGIMGVIIAFCLAMSFISG